MIFTDRTITVRKGESRIDEPIVVYRGDYELEVRFTILNSRFKFMSGTNMIESEKASYGQLAILTPYGGNIFSDIVRCNDGSVTFVLTAEMLNQIEEVGLYSFQIRLMDYNKESRVSIPPIEFGIEVREPIASEDHDNSVNNAIVGYSIAKVVDPKEENVGDTFYESGNYNKTKWETGDRISEGKLNKIEDAIDKINQNERNDVLSLGKRIDNNFNVLNSIKADTSTTDSLQTQINNLILESGGDSNLEVVQARGSFSTLGMRLDNIDNEIDPLNISYDGVVYDNLVDAINSTFSSIVETGCNLWDYGTYKRGYAAGHTWVYDDYDVSDRILNAREYILSFYKVEGFINNNIGSVIFYDTNNTEIGRIPIKQETHFEPPMNTVKIILRFQVIVGDPAPTSGTGIISGIRLVESNTMKLNDNIRISELDNILKHFDRVNLFNRDTIVEGVYLDQQGTMFSNDRYILSDFIPVKGGEFIICNKTLRFVNLFDISKVVYGCFESVKSSFYIERDGYIRVSIAVDVNSIDDTMMNYGTVLLPYTTYNDSQLVDVLPLQEDISHLKETTQYLIPNSLNLFNKNTITNGYYCGENGKLESNQKYFVSDYIRVQPLDTVWSNMPARFFSYFNAGKKWVGNDDYIRSKTLGDNICYVRITYDVVYRNEDIMVNVGPASLPFDEYDERKTLDTVIELEDRVEPIIGAFEDNIMISPNLANPTSFILGVYTDDLGNLLQNSTYFVTGLISVEPGDKIQANTRARFLATYDANGKFIENYYKNTVYPNSVYTVGDGVYAVRYTFWSEDIEHIMVYLGTEFVEFMEFGKYFIKSDNTTDSFDLQANSLVGNNAANSSVSTLSSGGILRLSDFPRNLKKGTCLSFYADFNSFSTLEIGKGGEGVYRSDWLKIDSTNVTWMHYENSLPVVNEETKEHDLNISKFLAITMSCDDEGIMHVNLATFGGYFRWDVNIGYEFNGIPFIKAGMNLSNVTLSATNTNFRKPVWLFGDSYFGVNGDRVIGQLKNLGYFNFLVDGLAGQGSSAAFDELNKCLEFGTPKYLVWCLGMNDSDDAHRTVLSKVRDVAASKGITLIAMKIPSVPSRLHEAKNSFIDTLDIRYVDGYKAVGATTDGTWYDGYLNAGDLVHPTTNGAIAIAMRILIDVPEILQYGMSELDKTSGDTSGDL